MSILFAVNHFFSSIRKFINEKQKEQDMKANIPIPRIIIERHIGENLEVGLGKYPTNIDNKSTTQLLQYHDKYYWLDKFTKEDKKLLYNWINMQNSKEHVLLEFEKVPPESVIYKLIQTKDANSSANAKSEKDKPKTVILQEGYFHYKLFKPIGMMETYYIDELANFAFSR
jgi:hypothetical protein